MLKKSALGPKPVLVSPHGGDVTIQEMMSIMLEDSLPQMKIYTCLIHFK